MQVGPSPVGPGIKRLNESSKPYADAMHVLIDIFELVFLALLSAVGCCRSRCIGRRGRCRRLDLHALRLWGCAWSANGDVLKLIIVVIIVVLFFLFLLLASSLGLDLREDSIQILICAIALGCFRLDTYSIAAIAFLLDCRRCTIGILYDSGLGMP